MNLPLLAPLLSRRDSLRGLACGFGYLALAVLAAPAEAAGGALLQRRGPRFPPRAKRVIFLFMQGGPSQVDTFDHKPEIERLDGKKMPFDDVRTLANTGARGSDQRVMKSPWSFARYGQSGRWVSELFPNVARRVDDLCFIHSLHTEGVAHGPATLFLHCGATNFVRPSMGAWITYGLGTENEDLPGFITICPTLAHGGVKNWGSAFLPARYQGVPLGVASRSSSEAQVKYIRNQRWTREQQRHQLDLLNELNRDYLAAAGPEAALEARIGSFELAFRMQEQMPTVQNYSDESAATLSLYGMDDPVTENFGRQCLLARRFAERGVRFIQVTHSDSQVQWDQHSDLKSGHEKNAREVDRPIAGLLQDLKQRGLLDDTLVMWGGEFGRTPVAQGKNGRDHNPEGFTIWLAGGGVKRGFKYGATDDYGYFAVDQKMHIHDLHATLLFLLGLDHEKLTYRYGGRDFRLTDVAGEIHREILA